MDSRCHECGSENIEEYQDVDGNVILVCNDCGEELDED
jgi:DNA-directed RNA polymerase subunit RPC12/RpoP